MVFLVPGWEGRHKKNTRIQVSNEKRASGSPGWLGYVGDDISYPVTWGFFSWKKNLDPKEGKAVFFCSGSSSLCSKQPDMINGCMVFHIIWWNICSWPTFTKSIFCVNTPVSLNPSLIHTLS